MKYASLLEIIAAAEKLSSGKLPAVQVPDASGSRVPAMLAALRERMRRERHEYLDDNPEISGDEPLQPVNMGKSGVFLPRSEINALNQLKGFCTSYSRTGDVPPVQFSVDVKDNHVNHIQLYGYACVPSMLLDFPKLEGINLHGEPPEAYFPHIPALEKLLERGVRAFVKNREIFQAQNVLPVASRFGQAQPAAVPKPADPQDRRAILERLITRLKAEGTPKPVQPVDSQNRRAILEELMTRLKAEGTPKYIQPAVRNTPAVRNPPVVMSTIKPVEYSLPSFWERLGVAAFLFLGFSVGAAGLGVVGYNYFRQPRENIESHLDRTIAVPEGDKYRYINTADSENLKYLLTTYGGSEIKLDDENRVVSLTIKETSMSGVLGPILQLRKLKKLDLSDNKIESTGLLGMRISSVGLEGLADLETLKLNNNKIRTLGSLETLTSLKELWIQNNPIDYNDSATKESLKELETRGVKVYR